MLADRWSWAFGARPRSWLLLPALIAGLGLILAGRVTAQTFTILYSFTATSPYPGPYINSDGDHSYGGLILSGNTLYGTANSGGSSGSGTVFVINTDGTDFTTLHSFTDEPGHVPTDGDGALPFAGLVLSGNTLYGTAGLGGFCGGGTLFAVKTDGTDFTTLYSFTATSGPSPYTNSDGRGPNRLLLSGNTLYGTAHHGGSSGSGTVFSLSLPPPQLTLIRSAANVVLTWPTNAAGFTLQSTTNLGSSAAWSTVSPTPVVVNNQNAVTNPISGTRKFYRLINP